MNNTIIAKTYRYFWKDKDGKLYVKYITDVEQAHVEFQKAIKENDGIVSCYREYVGEINYAYIGFTENIKLEEKKEEKESEKSK